LLIAIAIDTDGKRSVLGCNVQLSEAEPHWRRKFLESLQKRGMHGVKLVVSDDHAGLRAARQAVMAGVPWQRCQFHTIRNAMAYVPKVAMHSEVARELRRVFDADEPAEAERRLKDIVARCQYTGNWLLFGALPGMAIVAACKSRGDPEGGTATPNGPRTAYNAPR
jgi:transposase-like protein